MERRQLGTTKASASGAWTYTTGTLAGGINLTATATDAAGNTAQLRTPSIRSSVSTDHVGKRAVSANWSTTADWSSPAESPTSSDVVVLNAAGTYTVTSTANETISELNTVSTATLAIAERHRFTVTNGTGAGVQAGTVSIASWRHA